jgi:hypothetical protein
MAKYYNKKTGFCKEFLDFLVCVFLMHLPTLFAIIRLRGDMVNVSGSKTIDPDKSKRGDRRYRRRRL